MASASTDLLRSSVASFLAATPAPAPPFVRSLADYLATPTAAVHTTRWIPTAEEAELRLELIRQLHKNIGKWFSPPKWELTAAQLSVLLLMPIQALRQRVDETSTHDESGIACVQPLRDTMDSLRYFFQGKHPQAQHRKRKTPGGAGSEAIEGASEPDNASVGRSDIEKRKCQDRDGNTCIFTGAALPDVCHIVPFALNSCQRNVEITKFHFNTFLHLFFPAHDRGDMMWSLVPGLGCSDKAWNMLCINTELHRYWSRPYWAVKYVGVTPIDDGPQQRLTMRFHWLRFKADNPNRKVNIDTADDARIMLAALEDASAADRDGACPGMRGLVAAHHRGSNHPLVSGQEFTVILDNIDDAVHMKRMMEIQWAVNTVAAMSGAAGPGDEDDDGDMSELDFARETYEWKRFLYGDDDDDDDEWTSS